MKTKITYGITALLWPALVLANDITIAKERQEKQYTSPNGQIEKCIALAKLPLGEYKKKDQVEEDRMCGINFYDNTVALCPKVWSTSPGTIINDFKGLATSTEQAEMTLCKIHGPMKTVAKFKQSINQADTSGTFSAASLLYYHMSRALDTAVTVPTSVYRSMDKDSHYARVTAKARPSAAAKMNQAGWNWISAAETNPSGYNQQMDLLTADKQQIYGALLKDKGERYGVEINGTRKSGWGKGQNFDFQKTPAFLALKTQGELVDAIRTGYQTAVQDPLMAQAFSSGAPSVPQMVLWMNELSEIALLDYIFSQQDRIGNIDFRWYWTYVNEQGEVEAQDVDDAYESTSRINMAKIKVPANLVGKNPVLVQKTVIGDNDAGGLIQYANYTKSTGMLDGVPGMTNPIAHMNKETYDRLQKLAADFKAQGENFQVLNSEVRLLGYRDAGDKRFTQLTRNTILAADMLAKNCRAGILKLDLVSFKKAVKGELQASDTSCDVN